MKPCNAATLQRFKTSTIRACNPLALTTLALAVIFAARPVQAQLTNGGPALELSGGAVTVPHAPDLNAFPITMTAWIRSTVPLQTGGIMGKHLDFSIDSYAVVLEGENIRATYGAP